MRKILSSVLLPTFVFALGLSLAPLTFAQSSEALLKEDVAEVARYMQEYKEWLAQTRANGYGELGFTYTTASIDKIAQDCNTLYRQKNFDETIDCLAKWDDEVTRFDTAIQQRLLALDKSYLNNTLTTLFISDTENWIKENEQAGYTFGEYKDAWSKLKQRLFALKEAWPSNPIHTQEQLYAWYDAYDAWAANTIAYLERQYEDAQQSTEENQQKLEDTYKPIQQ